LRNKSKLRPAGRRNKTLKEIDSLRKLVVIAGVVCAVFFIAVGLFFRFQLYGDASIFSYAVAVQDSWAFHWHNISNRAAVYLYAHVPAEFYAHTTGDARGAIEIYAFLFYAAQLFGLGLTYVLDRSKNRLIFVFACASTALVAPLIFGSPTEMWLAHALFWPALAAAHCAPRPRILAAAFLTFLPLAFTHEGAIIFIATILLTLLLRRGESARFWHCLAATAAVIGVWIFVRIQFPPDTYTGKVLSSAAKNVFNLDIILDRMILLIVAAIGGFLVLLFVLRSAKFYSAAMISYFIVLLALMTYWIVFDPELHADERYYLRTAVIILTPAVGLLAVCAAFSAKLIQLAKTAYAIPNVLFARFGVQTFAGAFLLILVIHAAETARFADAWRDHLALFQSMVTQASARSREVEIDAENPEYEELPWFSTLPYLSVLVAPDFKPARLGIDPRSDYFWITCATATASVKKAGPSGIPAQSREMIRRYSCQHRRQ
jgi:hypothetical protein